MKWAGWGVLALYLLHRKTWGACDCEGLRRRLNVAHRETRDYQEICRTVLDSKYGTYPTVD